MKITIIEIKQAYEDEQKRRKEVSANFANPKLTPYTAAFKEKIVAFIYQENMQVSVLSKLLTGHASNFAKTLQTWLRRHGGDVSGFIHGKTVRLDVRSKCLIVKEYLEEGLDANRLSVRHKIPASTIFSWIQKYKDTYEEYVTLPAGVPYIVKEEKQVFGRQNIQQVREALIKTREQLTKACESDKYSESFKVAIDAECQVLSDKEEALTLAVQVLQENGIQLPT